MKKENISFIVFISLVMFVGWTIGAFVSGVKEGKKTGEDSHPFIPYIYAKQVHLVVNVPTTTREIKECYTPDFCLPTGRLVTSTQMVITLQELLDASNFVYIPTVQDVTTTPAHVMLKE